MAEVKDKAVTVESLSALHEYNKVTYETKENVEVLLETKFNKPENDIIPIKNGGTNASDGATGLANLFADGVTVLSSYQYGDELPEAGTVGRIFFKSLYNKYDVNADGVVDETDVDIITNHYNATEEITDASTLMRADVNEDGEIDLLDASLVIDYINKSSQ